MYVMFLFVVEYGTYFLINNLRKDFQWLITSEDEEPDLDKKGLKKFWDFGFDPKLGWVRKPNTSKTEAGKFGRTRYNIGKKGYRENPGFEGLKKRISCYGDSFTFARQVNDNETWEWYLSSLTNTNVLNFGVGNYGVDQALLRLKREYPKNKTKIVIMGIVPSTIVRIMGVWKHYNEYGNTFGFKPRYMIREGKLKLIENFINTHDKFLEYKMYLPLIRRVDYFYKTKFRKEMIQFPYFVSVLTDPFRNIPLILRVAWFKYKPDYEGGYPTPMKKIMDINLKLRRKMFKQDIPVRLLRKIIEEFVSYGEKKGFTPVLLWMPQKDDLIHIKKKRKNYYKEFLSKLDIKTIDLTKYLINEDLDSIYSDDNKYGGHYSKIGNKLVAEIIKGELNV